MEITLSPSDPVGTLDRVMRTFREPGTVYILRPGRYTTRGSWAFPESGYVSQAPGTTLRAEGTGKALISLAADAQRADANGIRAQRNLEVWNVGAGASIKGITFDGCEELFRDANPKKAWFVTVGVRAYGAISIEDWEVTGLRGGYAALAGTGLDNEAFCLSMIGEEGGSVIRRGRVYGCAPNSYVTALNIGHRGPKPARSIVEDVNVDVAEGNWMALGVNQNVHVNRFFLDGGCRNGVYNDTGSTLDVTVEGSVFLGVDRLVSLVAPPLAEGRGPRGNVHLKGVTASIVGDWKGESRGVELWDQAPTTMAPATMGPVVLTDCEIEAAGTFFAAATFGRELRSVLYLDCILPDYRISGPASSALVMNCRRKDGQAPDLLTQ